MTQGCGWRRLCPYWDISDTQEHLYATEATHPFPRALAQLHPPARDKNEQNIEKHHMVQL